MKIMELIAVSNILIYSRVVRVVLKIIWNTSRTFSMLLSTLTFLFLDENKDPEINLDNETGLGGKENWMISYLKAEQAMSLKRLDQQRQLLNITERLLGQIYDKVK